MKRSKGFRYKRAFFEPIIASLHPDDVHLLPIDVTGVKPGNHIKDEVHAVNVAGGKQILQPGAGSFYTHDVVVKNKITGEIYKKDIDYIFVAMNYGKTRLAQVSSAVYEFIYMVNAVVGEVVIEYHAFGGDVLQEDIKTILQILKELLEDIKIKGFLTCATLKNCALVIKILERIQKLEEKVEELEKRHKSFWISFNKESLQDGKFTFEHKFSDCNRFVWNVFDGNNKASFPNVTFDEEKQTCTLDFSNLLLHMQGTYKFIMYKSIMAAAKSEPDPRTMRFYSQSISQSDLIDNKIVIQHKLGKQFDLVTSVKDDNNLEVLPDINYADRNYLVLDFKNLVPLKKTYHIIIIRFGAVS